VKQKDNDNDNNTVSDIVYDCNISLLLLLLLFIVSYRYRRCDYIFHNSISIYVFNNIIEHYKHFGGMTMLRYCEMSLYFTISKPLMYNSTTNVRQFIGRNQ